ncbi:hypothetical protein [Chlorogloea sp. CCALA 695]|uniref:hypothetical protein n=1 Tax=Chlorogloea sp. CCALA 695 TaxID=2107693 RepID=UPI000D07E862|nr:hypothetical protein [Chlorogloea sp. CCALA 695]PSB27469.1 hypothetical protein C7B70_22465 [Chlorogloea sp. CCALA 695]
MAKRFGDLEKQAIAILANGGNPALSQDKRLANYWTWKTNPSNEAHNLPSTSERPKGRKTNPVYLKPFALTLPANILGKVTISQRSQTAATEAVLTACGLVNLAVGTDTALALKAFTPARVYYRTGEALESAPRISRITKETYKSLYTPGDEGFSVPFGRKSTDSLAARQAEIKAALPGSPQLVTFSPEKYRG